MLESITVENIFCFKNSTSLSFLAGKERNRNTDDQYCGFTTVERQNILKLVYIYGNNGAGKSKFLVSLRFFVEILLRSNKEKTDKLPYYPFAFDEDCLSKPSMVSVDFNIDESRYRYTLKWNSTKIIEEKIEYLKAQSSLVLLKRINDDDLGIIIEDNPRKLGLSMSDKDIIKRDVLYNSSILSYVSTKNIENQILNDIANYFRKGIRFIKLDSISLPDRLPDGKDGSQDLFKQVILNVLRSVDTNIRDYDVFDVKPELPQEILDMFKDKPEMISVFLKSLPKHAVNTLHEVHANKLMPLPLDNQSRGTKEILRLLVVLNDAVSKGRMVVLDDFSSGIHRSTLREILKYFLGVDKYGQLMITTQDYSLLDSELVRRDSVRLVSKDEYGVSSIENLTAKDIHKNLSLPKFLATNNRFGQLPKIDPEVINRTIEFYNNASASINPLTEDDGDGDNSEDLIN